MKKLIEAIVNFLNGIIEEKTKQIEQPVHKIYMPGERIPYDESTIEDVECEIIQ